MSHDLSPVREPDANDRSSDEDGPGGADDDVDDSEAGDPSDSEGESCGSVCDITAPTAPEDDGCKHPWNTPEGWARVRTGIDDFMKTISNHGHTCAVCGERKQNTKKIPVAKILEWNIAIDRAELEDILYTQYPKTTHAYNVSCVMSVRYWSQSANGVPGVSEVRR